MELPKITPKQEDIIFTIFEYRFINRDQLQKVLGHKDAKRVNVWLKDLVSKNYLGRIYSKKLFENTKPAIYYISLNGLRWIRENKVPKKIRKNNKVLRNLYFEKNKSDTFINHCLYISGLYTNLAKNNFVEEVVEGTKYKSFTFSFTPKQRHLFIGPFKEYPKIIPDAYIKVPDVLAKIKPKKIKSIADESNNKRYFLDLWDNHVPQYALRHRVNQIIEFYDYDYPDAREKGFPTILFVFENPKRIRKVRTFIKDRLSSTGNEDNLVFLLTTSKELKEKGFGDPSIWKIIPKDDGNNKDL